MDYLDALVQICTPTDPWSAEEFSECWNTSKQSQNTVFMATITSYTTWLFMLVPPFIALGVGKLLMKVGAWIGASFTSSPN
jgi:hypothetical protein